jgi:DNA-binding MarR family transcriptional regulator/N-acetylglutamate synthase-like GNAT family acetyltransferase
VGDQSLEERVEAVRRFNRFYTQHIRVLNERYLRSRFSVAEARIMWELAQRSSATTAELCSDLGLDPGYTSRILSRLRGRGQIDQKPSENDPRQAVMRLSEAGRKSFAKLDARSRDDMATVLAVLPEKDQRRLVEGMNTIQRLLSAQPEAKSRCVLRPHRPGDMGWVVQRHGVIYSEEYGWDERFEAHVAGIVAEFIPNFDSKKERCWIAELNGEPVGCLFLVKLSGAMAEMRLLLVEPKVRGMGVGSGLVDQCVRFAREAGYRKIILDVNKKSRAARHIFEKAGFRTVEVERRYSFGHRLAYETWELAF